MRVADVSGTGDGGQSLGRETSTRVGLGLLARFLGAVFLVLLGGLLLLDRALQRANSNQAELDSQSAALLTEAFMGNHAMVLDRAADAGDPSARQRSALPRCRLERLLATSGGARKIWVNGFAGRRLSEETAPPLFTA